MSSTSASKASQLRFTRKCDPPPNFLARTKLLVLLLFPFFLASKVFGLDESSEPHFSVFCNGEKACTIPFGETATLEIRYFNFDMQGGGNVLVIGGVAVSGYKVEIPKGSPKDGIVSFTMTNTQLFSGCHEDKALLMITVGTEYNYGNTVDITLLEDPYKEGSFAGFLGCSYILKDGRFTVGTSSSIDKADQCQKTFTDPMYEGMPLDRCLYYGSSCSGEAANEWCKQQGYVGASSFEEISSSQTKIIGDGEVCPRSSGDNCDKYSSITCNSCDSTTEKSPPQANFTIFPLEGSTPLTITSNGSSSTDSDGSITSYQWSTSDGKTASDSTASFVFDKEGSYTITLTVTDNDGLTNSSSQTVTVKESKFEVVSVTSKYPEDAYFLFGINHDVTYTATVDWGTHEPDFIRFKTSLGKSYDVPTTGTTAEKSLDVGHEFVGCGEQLQVTAFAKDGEESEVHWTNANVANPLLFVPTFLLVEKGRDFSYKASLGITFDLLNLQADAEESIRQGEVNKYWKDLLGLPPMYKDNAKFEAKFEPKVTTEITSEGKAKFDFEIGEVGLSTERLLKGKVIGLGFTLSPKLSVVSRFDCSLDKWQWEESSLGISGSFTGSPPPWYMILPVGPVPVPVYAKLSATVSGDGSINFKMEPDPFKPESGQLDMGVSGRGAIGAGVSEIVSIEGFLTGGSNFIFIFKPQPSIDEIRGLVQVGIAAYLLIWKWEPELPLKWEWSKKYTRSGGEWRSLATNHPVEPKLIERDYLNHPNYATLRSSTRGLRDTTPAPVQTIVFPYSDADTSGNNNAVYATWLSDNPGRSAINRTQVVFATWNGTDWTDPQPIADDGTADFHPKILAFSDNSALATWEDTQQVLTDTAQFEDSVKNLEIAVANYDAQTQQWQTQRLSNNAYLDRSPKLAGIAGNGIVTWISNETNDLMGSATNPNKLWFAQYLNNQWSAPQLIAEMPYPLLKYNVAYNGQTGYAVFSVDTDGDVTTIEDHELFQTTFSNGVWSALAQLTTDTVVDDNPQLGFDPTGNLVLTWLKDSELSSSVNLDMNQRVVVRKDETGYSSNLADFKLAQSSDGKLAIVWAEPSKNHSSDLHALFYNPANNTWGGLRQLTADDETEKRVAVTFSDADTLIALYNRSQVGEPTTTSPSGNVPMQISTDLYMLKHIIRAIDFTAIDLPDLGKGFIFNGQGNEAHANSRFAGGILIEGDSQVVQEQTVSLGQSATVSGVITPLPEHIGQNADIVTVGFYVKEGFLKTDEPSAENCDPALVDSVAKGGYYMMNQRDDQYCSWIVQGNDSDKSWCVSQADKEAVARKRPETPGDYFSLWDGNLQSLKAIDQVTLTDPQLLSSENGKTLYQGQFDAPGHVCFYFGYRLADGTLVFNGEKTINIRVKP